MTSNVSNESVAQSIADKFTDLGIIVEPADIIVGAVITRYMFNVLSPKTRMCDVIRCGGVIQRHINSSQEVRIVSSVEWINSFAVEVANDVRRTVELDALLNTPEFKEDKGRLSFVMGEDVKGNAVIEDLAKLPHLLIAGTTGSGKSILLNDVILSLISKYGPDYLRFLMIGVNSAELSIYDGMPHNLIPNAITDADDALSALDYLVDEMETRYGLLRMFDAHNIAEYNEKVGGTPSQRLPYIVLIVDEISAFMTDKKSAFETRFIRLAQKSRAAGIHAVLTTQRPSSDVITGTIKAVVPCRAALKVFSPYDSMAVLDSGGAEKLIGRGDMLFKGNRSCCEFTRVQCAYVNVYEARTAASSVQSAEADFDESVSEAIFSRSKSAENEKPHFGVGFNDELRGYYKQALKYWLEQCGGMATLASVQRGLNIGYGLAAQIFNNLVKKGFVEAPADSDGTIKPLKVMITSEQLDRLFPDEE